jgi:quinol monooxygenase YgiN
MSQPLNVVAILEAQPGKEAELYQLLVSTLPAFQQEPGCLSYALLVDQENAARMVTFERWKDAESLAQHMQSETMAKAKPQLAQILATPMQQIKLDALPGSSV